MSIFCSVFSHLQSNRHKTALKYSGLTVSYAQLDRAIKKLAKLLAASGVVHGQKVLILLPNCPEFITGFFSVTYVGAVAVLVDTKFNEELYDICRENNVKVILTNKAGEEKINRIWGKVAEAEQGDMRGQPRILPVENFTLFKSSAALGECETEYLEESGIKPEDTAMILYTSGSTGKPKGVVNTHETLEAALKNYVGTLPLSSSDSLVAVTPFFHSYCFGSCMLAGLASGSTLLVQQSFQPRVIMKLITEERATIFQGVPYMYNLMAQHFDRNAYSFDTLKYCISAGAPLTGEVAEEFHTLTGKVIHQEYGSSETGTIALNLSDGLDRNVHSVGRPLKNVQVRLLQEDGLDGGIIQVKSPGRSIGYVGEEGFAPGWYTTGDMGKLDEYGFIYILGRVKRLINVAGLKVNPAEVEMHLLKHPEVADVMVRGAGHTDFGEVVEAMVVRRSINVTENDLIKFCQGHLALYKVPKIIRWVESLPKSGTGKTISM